MHHHRESGNIVVSAEWEYAGDKQCEECGGGGIAPGGKLCTRCLGTGLLPVFKQHTVSTPPVQSSKRRRFPRYYTDLPVRLRDHHEEELAGRCGIIAEGGIAAILPKAITTGSVVTLELPIPTLDPPVLETLGLVRNQLGLRHGFEFVSLKDSEREAIRQFCVGLVRQSDDS